MKVAILHSGDLSSISLGGVDRYIKSLIAYFDDDEVTVFGTTTIGEHTIGKIYKKTYYKKIYSFIAISSNKHHPLSLYYTLNLVKWLRVMDEYDLIYAQRVEFCIPFWRSRQSNKLIQMIHGSSKYDNMFWGKAGSIVHGLIEKESIRIANHTYIILNRKEYGVPYYKKKYKSFSSKISYGRNPINLSIYHPRDKEECRKKNGLSENSFIVIYCGRIEDIPKRTYLLPYISKELTKIIKNLEFVVIGSGCGKKRLIDLVFEMGQEDIFKILGYVEDTNTIAEHYCGADVSINLSTFEGTCTSIIESIACGTPVAATDTGDIHECIKGNANGIIINQGTDEQIVKDMSNALIAIYNDKPIMDEVYRLYDGERVVKDIRSVHCK